MINRRVGLPLVAAAATATVLTGCAGTATYSSGAAVNRVAPTQLPTLTASPTPPHTRQPATHRRRRTTDPPSRSSATHTQHASTSAALAALAAIAVKGRAPMTGYNREAFGSAWTDDNADPFGHNGCDTRNDILRRDIIDPVVEADTNECVVLSGILHDPYTATSIDFRRGVSTSWQVQIDHVVALGDAWQTGARQWSADKRQNLANDPLNLLAVDGSENESKGDGDAATWLPPNREFWCRYVARQVAVKAKYGLWMTAAEKAASRRVLLRCPDQSLPHEPGSIHPRSPYRIGREPTTRPPSRPPSTSPGGNCEPGYSPCLPIVDDLDCDQIPDSWKPIRVTGDDPYRLDSDGDGWGCEP